MKVIHHSLEEAFAILQADNPDRRLERTEHGIWLQQRNGTWAAIVSRGADNLLRLFGQGENTLTMTDEMFQRLIADP